MRMAGVVTSTFNNIIPANMLLNIFFHLFFDSNPQNFSLFTRVNVDELGQREELN